MAVSSLERACPRCGREFEKPSVSECPYCGTKIVEGTKKCPACQVDLTETPDGSKASSIDKSLDLLLDDLIEIESAQVKKEGKRFCCPKCAWLLDGTESRCPNCYQVLTGKYGLQCPICGMPVEKAQIECPKCGIALARVSEEAKPMIPFVSKPKEETAVKLDDVVSSRTCPACGAISQKGLRKCPICRLNFSYEGPPEDKKDLTKAQSADDALSALKEIEKQAQTPLRERKLKPTKVTTAPVVSQASARGLSNGVGATRSQGRVNGSGLVNGRSKVNGLVNGRSMVNGLSKINGVGAVNGKSLVNGTGISNGLRAKARERAAKRTMFLARWQFLAVLVAILIVIPTFVFLSSTKKSDEYVIDGQFGDWEDSTTFGTRIQSVSPMTNITEWAISAQSTDLFVYFKTESLMMSTSQAESYYLFVDSDGSNATGYAMESIGADYMLQLTGWDHSVNSTSMMVYASSSDQLNWSAWAPVGSLSYSLDGTQMEAHAGLPAALDDSARFVLVSKDSLENGSVSYAAPAKGAVLVVEQAPSDQVASDNLVSRSSSVQMLTVRFRSDGGSGRVDQVNPVQTGAMMVGQIQSFSLDEGEEHEITIAMDTSDAADGDFVSVKLSVSSIVSSFASVEVVGDGASAYVVAPPAVISIDGSFADWQGRLSEDQDSASIESPNVNIDDVGNVSTTQDSCFYVSVKGEMCSGTVVPAMVVRPSGSGGGGGVIILPRHTAEDILRIFIDSDRSNSTGELVAYSTAQIGADQMIEVRGLYGKITSANEFDYASGQWTQTSHDVDAAKDSKRIEIGVTSSSLGGSSDIDFIVETTTWRGHGDYARFDSSSMRSLTRSWMVDSSATSAYATAMSYQRKVFYDGTNYWSLFFDGSNTVHKYSTDDGVTWTSRGSVFQTSGVNETSIWYDHATRTVYAVGDTASASTNVYIQIGTVDPVAHTISWAGSDSTLAASTVALGGKNTYVCKDSNGYLWILSSNCTQVPAKYLLTAFKSTAVNSTSSWVRTGDMFSAITSTENAKGSIVPAGSGSDVWAVYAHSGKVYARKYTGSWQSEVAIFTTTGSTANTDNSPPSVVVDTKGVVHVVYGTSFRLVQSSIPRIEYSHNATDSTSFTTGVDLDQYMAGNVGDYYPTISLESSTNKLYVLWLQSDTALVPKIVMGRVCSASSWSNMTISSETSYAKQYLTSIYNVSSEYKICWQWTQNTTSQIQVLFDGVQIPEFGEVVLPMMSVLVIAVISRIRRRTRR